MQVVAPPKRSSTPTNVVYPVVTAPVPVNIPLYNTPVLPAPAAVTTVARETVVSETVAPVETAVEPEADGKVCFFSSTQLCSSVVFFKLLTREYVLVFSVCHIALH